VVNIAWKLTLCALATLASACASAHPRCSRWGCGGRAGSAEGNAAGADGPAVVQLPDAVAGDLRQLAFEADRLKDEYATCYRYVNGPVK
jgi:hypothetical protein